MAETTQRSEFEADAKLLIADHLGLEVAELDPNAKLQEGIEDSGFALNLVFELNKRMKQLGFENHATPGQVLAALGRGLLSADVITRLENADQHTNLEREFDDLRQHRNGMTVGRLKDVLCEIMETRSVDKPIIVDAQAA